MNSVLDRLSGCTLLSIDILDTLVFRLTHRPEDVFDLVGREVCEAGLSWDGFEVDGFREARMVGQRRAREQALRERGSGEVSIEEIYRAMGVGEKLVDACVAIELRVEKACCCANPEALEWLRFAQGEGLAVVLASDMYWSSGRLVELLEACGVERSLYDRIFVSCECGGDKASGAVFEEVMRSYPTQNLDTVLHIGDRMDADVDAAKRLGFQAILYGSEAGALSGVYEYERLRFGAPLGELAFLRNGAGRSGNGFFEVFGSTVMGPAVVCFCEWVLDRCEAEAVGLLCPLMREAEVFAPVLEAANRRRGGVVRIEPLFVSRAAAWLPSLEAWTEAAAEELMDRTGMRVMDVLRYLGLGKPEGFDGALRRSELRGESNAWARERLKAYLLSHDVCERLDRAILERRAGLLGYLRRAMEGAERVATVDLGFRGTIPSYLERVLRQGGEPRRLKHWLMLGTRELLDLRAGGMEISGYLSEPGRCVETGRNLRRTSFFLEQLLTGASGSVEGYAESEGVWEPVLGSPIRDRFSLEAKAASLAGILSYQGRYLDAKALAGGRLDFGLERCEELGAILRRAVEWPTEEEGRHLGRLVHDFNGGAFAERRVCTESDRQVLEESGDVDTYLRIGRSVGVHWPEGVVAARSGADLLRLAVSGAGESDSFFAALFGLAEAARLAGCVEVVLYGAGDAGRTLQKAAGLAGLVPLFFVDRKESLWGERIEGVEVVSLEAALERAGGAAFLVGSFAFAAEIERTILTADAGAKVFSVKNLME